MVEETSTQDTSSVQPPRRFSRESIEIAALFAEVVGALQHLLLHHVQQLGIHLLPRRKRRLTKGTSHWG